jgi:pseudouridine-5'-phosphate glycosidase
MSMSADAGDLLVVHPEVTAALAGGRAVVALESTIVTHGMPFPQNLETARAVEAVVRAGDAVPATIAVIDGRIVVGLDDAALARVAEAGPTAAKASRRDLAVLLASRRLAGTTVATTMMAAAMAGIRIFATGGIGGVHRGAETSFDISADLRELGRTPVAVVCAGAKSILDLPKTLEVLETEGVPVIGYRTDAFPAFFARDSGVAVPHRLDGADVIARAAALHWRLGGGGVLVANPIPEADALSGVEIDAEIARAVAEAAAAGVAGKDVTPFLLDRINTLTAGRSLTANIALVKNNAALAAEIAAALAAG